MAEGATALAGAGIAIAQLSVGFAQRPPQGVRTKATKGTTTKLTNQTLRVLGDL